MALIIPTDSYVSVADADVYHAARPSGEAWGKLDQVQKERLLVAASDYLDAYYPLKNGLNAQMRSGVVPVHVQVVKAVCELALQSELTANEAPKKSSVRVGEISVTYDLSSGSKMRFAFVDALLRELRGRCGFVPMRRG